MVRSSWALAGLAAIAGVRAARQAAPIVPGAYIVEFEDNHDAGAFYDSIAGEASKTMDLNYKLFNGASIQFHDEENSTATAEKVAAMPQIKQVWPVRRYHIPEYEVLWTGEATEGDEITKRAASDTFSPHVMTQVDQLREKGFTGEGIKLAIIDTGVDYKHPALGGCFGPGCLVSFGYDLVGDAFNGSNKPTPDADPMDCGGHGTHVAGIIAGQVNNPFGIIGAAPGVTLGMFRVFGCRGDVGDDILIAAYNRAYEAGADIITASIGGSSGWTEEAWSVAVSRIVENGVPCTVSAGNDGSEGLFYSATAANGKKATAIASIDNTISPVLFSNATYSVGDPTTNNVSFGYTAGTPANWTGVTLPLWAVNYNTSDPANACDPFPNSTTNLTNYIVLMRRGTCFFTQKVQNAVDKGARYVIIYNNVPGTLQVDVTAVKGAQGVAMVSPEQGAIWINALEKGSNITIAMTNPMLAPKSLLNEVNKASAGFVSTYSSWGPTFEVDAKPQFSSPGGLILSTYPRALGAYAVLSGTSMACPLAAGIYALLMNARGTKDPRTLENLLAATAKPNLFHNGVSSRPYLAPVPQQGAGLIQAYDAAYATTLLSVSGLSFNDSDHHVAMQNFSISNQGKSSVIYTLSHVGAGTAYTFPNESTIFPAKFPDELVTLRSFATMNFSGDSTVTIPAGERRIIHVSVTPPPNLNKALVPVYSGYIAINGSDGSALSLPYMGVAGSLHSLTVLDPIGTFISNAGRNASRLLSNATFLLPPPGHANDTEYQNKTTMPQINVNLAMGSPFVRVDVVPIRACGNRTTTDVLGVNTYGQVQGYPLPWQSRDPITPVLWDGKLEDGTYLPAGLYKLVVRALRIFGDRTKASEYDVVETTPFRIRYFKNVTEPLLRRQSSECE